MHRVPVQHLLQHFNLLSPEKKAPSWLNKNLYLSSAKALQPRCLSPSAAESSRISSACDTRCLGGKFNYFPLLDVQFRSAVFFLQRGAPSGRLFLRLSCDWGPMLPNRLKSELFSCFLSPPSALGAPSPTLTSLVFIHFTVNSTSPTSFSRRPRQPSVRLVVETFSKSGARETQEGR